MTDGEIRIVRVCTQGGWNCVTELSETANPLEIEMVRGDETVVHVLSSKRPKGYGPHHTWETVGRELSGLRMRQTDVFRPTNRKAPVPKNVASQSRLVARCSRPSVSHRLSL